MRFHDHVHCQFIKRTHCLKNTALHGLWVLIPTLMSEPCNDVKKKNILHLIYRCKGDASDWFWKKAASSLLLKSIIFFVLLRLSLWTTDHIHWFNIHWESQRRGCEAGLSVYSCYGGFWASGHWVEPAALWQPERRESGEYLIKITLKYVRENVSLEESIFDVSLFKSLWEV